MIFFRNKKKKYGEANNNNRINLIFAIIFLLGLSIFIKLYNLQITKFELFSEKANSQHQVFNILEQQRGRIFFQDNLVGENEKLYPAASNKEFALVYAIPKEIKDADAVSEKLYEFFKKEKVEKEVDELMKKEDEDRLRNELAYLKSMNLSEEEMKIKENEAIKKHELIIKDQEYLKLKEVKKEKEIEVRKEAEIKNYLEKITKRNDPYEPLEQKVDEEVLKKLFISLTESEDHIKIDELEIKGGKLLISKNLEELKFDGINFIPKIRRYFPEKNISSHILGFVGYKDDEERGRYGLEGFFDEELFGMPGSIKTGRGAAGDLIIINEREYIGPQNGSDLILTINRTIQYTVCKKLNEAALRHGADGGSIIVMDPSTGAILSMCSWPDYDPNDFQNVDNIRVYNNPAIFAQYEPGSVFKAITMAAALDQEKVTPETTYNDDGQIMINGWHKPIRNSDYETFGGHGKVDMNFVLEASLNTGAIYAMKQVGSNTFSEYVRNFGFGEKTGIEMETENGGNINNLIGGKIKEIDAATASFGQGISVTPLQMVASYSAIANGGILMKPYLVKEIVHVDGKKDITKPKEIRRIISERASLLLSGMLVNVVEKGHSAKAKIDGYYVAGKTGTAQVASQTMRGYSEKYIHTFVGFAPVEKPKFVMLVKLDNPKGIKFAESSVVPLFKELADFILNYYEVPKER